MEKYIVYKLIDPRNNEIRYIGKSEQGINRLKEHLKPSSLKNNTHKDNWIKQLLSLGLKPEIEILEVCISPNELFEAEEKWYNHYKDLGSPLTNLTECGKGTRGYKHTEETVQRLKEKALKRDKAAYQNPHNKKKNVVMNNKLYRNCTKCKLDKPIEEFSVKIKQKTYQGYCQECNRIYQNEWKQKNPAPILSQEEFNASRLPGAIAGGETSKRPERRLQASIQRSKAIIGTHTETGEIVKFPSALKAKEAGFQNSNIGQAIKFNKPYKNYIWKFSS